MLTTISLINQSVAVTDGAQQVQASFSALYACVFPSEALKNTVVKGVYFGTVLDFPPAPKWSRLVNQETTPIYFPHHKTKDGAYAHDMHDSLRVRMSGPVPA